MLINRHLKAGRRYHLTEDTYTGQGPLLLILWGKGEKHTGESVYDPEIENLAMEVVFEIFFEIYHHLFN